ncbi:hypothetical protein B0H13DRAFT_2174710 [Mycena leptocephala]|nr:hypothetical protein B0H13DRAFT_2174710 [Mycena leptocephala]
MQLPWHQLTVFGTEDITVPSCLRILRHTSNLVEGDFRIRSSDEPSVFPDAILLLTQLQSLTLGVRSDDENDNTMPMTVLDYLKAPALKTLTLKYTPFSRRNASDISPFSAFVSRSPPFQLHTLVLSFVPTTTDTLIDCLKATPSLIHLDLRPSHFILDLNPVFHQLTGHCDFLPKLEFLRIGLTDHPSNFLSALDNVVQMLSWRWSGVGIVRLQSFRLAHKDKLKLCEAIRSHPQLRPLTADSEGVGIIIRL